MTQCNRLKKVVQKIYLSVLLTFQTIKVVEKSPPEKPLRFLIVYYLLNNCYSSCLQVLFNCFRVNDGIPFSTEKPIGQQIIIFTNVELKCAFLTVKYISNVTY